jgi:diguanylate cyclase (GGDEF)-like protein
MNWITPYHLGPEDRPHIRALHMALVQDLYERGRIPVMILTASMALFYAILRPSLAASPWLRVFFVALTAVLWLRTLLSLQGDQLNQRNRRIPNRFMLYFAGAFATGLLLGAVALASFVSLAPGPLFLLCLCYMGICAGAVVSMAASPLCFMSLVIPAMGGLVLGGLLFPPFGLGWLFATSIAVGTTALTLMSKYVHLSLCRNTLLSERLGDLALRDALTGLRNRRYLQEFMHEETPRVLRRWLGQDAEIRSRRSISLILLDLDFFKQVNDQFGHAAGDAVLVQVAQLLREVVRKPDLVLRWGGEEFLILALDSDRSAPPLIAVRVHERLAQHAFILPGGQEYRLTCSVGFAIYPFHPERPDGLLWEQVFRLADQSLYTSKEHGRNQIHGITAGAGDPDAVIAAMGQPEPAFMEAEVAGLIRVI